MYSSAFLELNKNAMVGTLRASQDRAVDSRILFGTVYSLGRVEQMTPVEVFACQRWHAGSSTPAEYRFSRYEIIGREQVSEEEVWITIRRGGLPAALEQTEEDMIRFVRENGEWRFGF